MGQQPGAPPGSRPGVMEGRGHTVGRYVHIYRAREAQGKPRDVEKGAVVTWKILYSGDREGKGTRTMTPNHADKDTACAAQRSGGSQREALSPRGNSTQIQLGMCVCVGGAGTPSPATPPHGSRADIPTYSHNGKRRNLGGRSTNIVWHRASPGSKQSFLESSLFSQVGSSKYG